MAPNPEKRKKATASSSVGSYDSNLFRSLACKNRYDEIPKDKEFVREKAFQLSGDDFLEIQENIRNRHWEAFTSYPKRASKKLAKEFFANAYQDEDENRPADDAKFVSYARGRMVPYDPQTINEMFGLPDIENCGYHTRHTLTQGDMEVISQLLIRPGEDWKRSNNGTPRKIYGRALTPTAKAWGVFVLHTFSPCANVSELNVDRVSLTYSIMNGEPVNVGRFLADNLWSTAHEDVIKPWLNHASLIQMLCERVRVKIKSKEDMILPGTLITGEWIRRNSVPLFEQYQPHPQHHQEPEEAGEAQNMFVDPPVQNYPTMADFERLNADVQRIGAQVDSLALEHREEARAQRRGLQAIYSAIGAYQSGQSVNMEANIFQEPYHGDGAGPSEPAP